CCILSIDLSAQIIKVGQHKIGHHTYTVSELGQKDHKQLFVKETNQSSVRRANQVDSTWTYAFIKPSREDEIKNAFIKVLGVRRIKELIPEKHITLLIYVDTHGKVLKVNYYLNNDSKFLLREINALTTFIKANILFKLPANVKEGSKL